MTIEELRQLMHRLHLDASERPQLIYVFYQTPDGLVNNLSISLHSARQHNRQPMTDAQLAELMGRYPDAQQATLLAVEHPQRGLTHWMDTHDVCRTLHTTRTTLQRWCRLGMLHPCKLGGRLYFDPADVEALMRSHAVQPNGRLDTSVLAEG